MPASSIAIGCMITIVMFSNVLYIDSYAQDIIGYSESTITVKSEKTYCLSNKTLQLTDATVQSIKGNEIKNATIGSQIVIEASITSNCEINNYPILILAAAVDSQGITRYLALQNTTMSQGDQTTVSFSWTPMEAGDYEFGFVIHACLRCSGDFGIIRIFDVTVGE